VSGLDEQVQDLKEDGLHIVALSAQATVAPGWYDGYKLSVVTVIEEEWKTPCSRSCKGLTTYTTSRV
jgi:hypothetical protein